MNNIKLKYSLYVLVVFLILTTVFSCTKKDDNVDITPPSTTDSTKILPSAGDGIVNVVVNPDVKGFAIPSSFIGLSYEINASISGKYLSSTFTKHVNLVKNLGANGLIRIGAYSTDNYHWINTVAPPTLAANTIYRDNIDRILGFSTATGWKCIIGVNLATDSASVAADEIKYINDHYASRVLNYEFGNEPDLYHNWARIPPQYPLYPTPGWYQVVNYLPEWENFYSKVHSAVPNAPISGSSSAAHVSDFNIPFVDAEHAKLVMFSHHYYCPSGSATSIADLTTTLLSEDNQLTTNVATLLFSANAYNLPFRWTECNSYAGGGTFGVSNKIASALWGADFMFNQAKLGVSGVNFHGGSAGAYTPIAYGDFNGVSGDVVPRPLYFGMLAFSLASKGTFIDNSTNNVNYISSLNCKVYSILGDDGKYYITVINKDQNKQAYVGITGLPTNHTTQIIRLTGTVVADVNTADNVLLGGATADSNGNWANTSNEKAGFDNTSYQLQVPKMSVAILIVDK